MIKSHERSLAVGINMDTGRNNSSIHNPMASKGMSGRHRSGDGAAAAASNGGDGGKSLGSISYPHARIDITHNIRQGFSLTSGELRVAMRQPLWLLQLAGTEVRRRVEPWARTLIESDSVAQLQVSGWVGGWMGGWVNGCFRCRGYFYASFVTYKCEPSRSSST